MVILGMELTTGKLMAGHSSSLLLIPGQAYQAASSHLPLIGRGTATHLGRATWVNDCADPVLIQVKTWDNQDCFK